MRRTKIVATLGPGSSSSEVILEMIRAGVDVFRLNFSHGSHEEQKHRVDVIRECSESSGRIVGILADLQGPKIRTHKFKDGIVQLIRGETFILDAALGKNEGTQERVGLAYKDLPKDVKAGDILLLDDGRVELEVNEVVGDEVRCIVVYTCELSNNKGINLKGGGLSAPALTDKDKEDLKAAVAMEVDFMALSFARTAEDVNQCRALVKAAGSDASIVTKVERAEAIDNIDEIIEASDVIMVARGDLGVEMGDAELPALQKSLIKAARGKNKVVITATQMMESMIDSPIPTRAEVFDVANAVLDGTDAVMLSGETAVGKYPAKTVEAMGRICEHAEKQRAAMVSDHRLDLVFGRVDEAIAMAAMYTANHLEMNAIASLTESGATVLWMSRISSGIPIYALTPRRDTSRKVTMYRGVYPISVDFDKLGPYHVTDSVVDLMKDKGIIVSGDSIVVTRGDMLGDQSGGSNTMKIVQVS
ncbi:Pyruvate kinase [hydrothermal vent metagenome]|uniref:pyruvate kinase n=1 Tax=hydrothermal vent metagenome TaxID=652676 RepID=A0A3B0X1A2_9ZZZZ